MPPVAALLERQPSGAMRISLIQTAQHESLVELLCELHAHYNDGAQASRAAVRSHLIENLLGAESPIRLVVASGQNGEVVGLAAIAFLFSLVEPAPEKRQQCLLKELFVRPSARGQGVGTALVAWVARCAVEAGCCRIDWPVKASNRDAIRFYERLGAERVAERLSYRLSGTGLQRAARAA